MITFDTETCGLHGPVVLIQYVNDNDTDITLFDCWHEPVRNSIDLLEEQFANKDVMGFNLVFDWFHIQKWYSMCKVALAKHGDITPIDYIPEMADVEEEARFYKKCIKPSSAMDLMLHARKGPYQGLMARKPIKVRRVPAVIAQSVADVLEDRVDIDGIYFSRRKDKYAPQWSIRDIEDRPDLCDIVLSFNASGGLKVLAEHALGVKEDVILKFTDIEPPTYPVEAGYAPFAKAISSRERGWKSIVGRKEGYSWPRHIGAHASHWAFNKLARKYGADDVKYTRDLWHHFGRPDFGDDDSVLACMVGAVRWHGFSVDVDSLSLLRISSIKEVASVPMNPKAVKTYLFQVTDAQEQIGIKSTDKKTLKAICDWQCNCKGDGCDKCGNTGVHPATRRAREVRGARQAKKRIEIYDKLIRAGRFHASFTVIGTLSSRMAGTDGLNAQGINSTDEVRECFTLADPGMVLVGGDFESFEVVLADAVYDDIELRKALTEKKPCEKCDATGEVWDKEKDRDIECDECNGTREAAYKMHALFAMELYPGKTYADIIKSKGTENDVYKVGKAGVFAMLYGGDHNTLVNNHDIDPEIAERAYLNFQRRFKGVARARQKIDDMFCSMKQPGGIGTKVIWKDPQDYIESLMGFRRYFTLENKICKELFDLANENPWKAVKLKITRNDREQTAGGAVASALYGAAFQIQAANMRAAANHVIQSSGATITKSVQRAIWDLQPAGVADWHVLPLNVHDEIMVPCKPSLAKKVSEIVKSKIEEFRPQVPLISIDWSDSLDNWSDK